MSALSYRPSQKLLHWFIFLLVFATYGVTYAEDLFERGSAGRDNVWWLHISLGLLLLVLVIVRLGMRVAVGAPAPVASTSPLEQLAAKVVHVALYALLVLIPVVGIVLAARRGMALDFFGLFTLPAPVGVDREAARSVQEIHELLANLILALVGIHALAALWHHYIRHDLVLRRMLPGG